MTASSHQILANLTLRVYALVFLTSGAGLGWLLGDRVGAISDGSVSDFTMTPAVQGSETTFNWLFFEIGVAAGLISCAVLLAGSFRATSPATT